MLIYIFSCNASIVGENINFWSNNPVQSELYTGHNLKVREFK